MTHAEFMTLQLFCENPGRVFTRYQIVDHVHGTDHIVTDRSVDVQIVGLRKNYSLQENILRLLEVSVTDLKKIYKLLNKNLNEKKTTLPNILIYILDSNNSDIWFVYSYNKKLYFQKLYQKF